MKSKNKILIYLLVSVILILGTSCRIFHPHQKQGRGVIIESRPSGKLEYGEIDRMSGRRNEVSGKKDKKSNDTKKSRTSKKNHGPIKYKKHKRR